MMNKIVFISIIFATFFSCKKAFLGEDEKNTPENNFEIFWEDFDKHYGLFEVRGWNWDSIYTVYQPQVNSQTTNEELWLVFRNMIDYLDDSHTVIISPNEEFIINGEGEDFWESNSAITEIVEFEHSVELLRNKYIENVVNMPFEDLDPDEDFFYGNIKNKDIGFIYLNGIAAYSNNMMDDILNDIGKHKAIIIDLRNNFGGDDVIAIDFAGRFADGEHLVYTVQERNGPNHNDFAAKNTYYTKPLGSQNYSKPVIILTDQWTVSAAEIFLLHMKAFSDVIQIGDSTSGDFSDTSMDRFLPNGWKYGYSIMMFLLPDGRSLDGIGHVPDVQIRNSVMDIESGNDKVIEEAIQYLFDVYDIE